MMFKEKAIMVLLGLLLSFMVTGPMFAADAKKAENTDKPKTIFDLAYEGKVEKLKAMVTKNPKLVAKKNPRGSTVLHQAAAGGHTGLITFLLKNGADIEAKSTVEATPLLFAAAYGKLDAVKVLLAKGANINAATRSGDSLFYAALRKHPKVVRFLISKGCKINPKNEDDETILHRISRSASAEIVKMFIDKGVPANSVSKHGFTPLQYAVGGGNVEVTKLLIKMGADVNQTPVKWDSWNPLIRATTHGHKEIIPILLKAGANVDRTKKKTGQTALHLAAGKGYGKVVHLLLEGGADLNARDIFGNTPLYYAARYGHKKAAKVLMAKGANGADVKKMKKNFGHSPILKKKFKNGDAVVWFLGHSGWAVKTANNLLIFDYYKNGTPADTPLLTNGCIVPEEIKDLKVTVFSSHSHGDHYMPSYFDWKKTVSDIHYVMGFKPDKIDKNDYTFIGPRKTKNINGMEVTTIESNDSGVGFYVRVDGVDIFHSGDHANRKQDFSGPFAKEIDYLAAKGFQPDIFFAPVSGCGFGDQVAVRKGVYYTAKKLSPRTLFPMHGGGERLVDFVLQAKKEGLKKKVDCPMYPGDWFFVKQGKVKKAKVGNVKLAVKVLAKLEAAEKKEACTAKKSCDTKKSCKTKKKNAKTES